MLDNTFIGTYPRGRSDIITLQSLNLEIRIFSKEKTIKKTKISPENQGRKGFAPRSGRGYARVTPKIYF